MSDKLGQALADALDIEARIAPLVRAALDEALAARPASVRELHITLEAREPVNVGRQHAAFPDLMQALAARVPVWLVGPAGSFKTTAAETALRVFGEFSAISIGPHTSQTHIMGYMDAVGNYHATEARKRFEFGGGLLVDEAACGGAVMVCLNALLANDVCAFPDGMVKRHPEFRAIAAANTIGMGADRVYVSAVQLDGSFLDRFAVLEWGYDEAFEAEIAVGRAGNAGLDWVGYVQALRHAVADLKVRHIISPRATLNGLALHAAGMAWGKVAEMVVWRGLDNTTRGRIEAHAGHVSLPRDGAAATAGPDGDAPADEGDAYPEKLHSSCNPAHVPCPKCGRSATTFLSRIVPGEAFCWRKRGGCGRKWVIA